MSLYLTHSYNVVKGDAELITVHFFLVWKDIEMPMQVAFQQELADVLD